VRAWELGRYFLSLELPFDLSFCDLVAGLTTLQPNYRADTHAERNCYLRLSHVLGEPYFLDALPDVLFFHGNAIYKLK
jgi:hypothetical protein